MYACILEMGGGFFEGVCTPSKATDHSYDPPPTPQYKRTGAPAMELRPDEDHAPR
jgi:hypothetical protein